MSHALVSELTDAYLILRKAENALQMIRDEQTHGLPEDAANRVQRARPCRMKVQTLAATSGAGRGMGLPARTAMTP